MNKRNWQVCFSGEIVSSTHALCYEVLGLLSLIPYPACPVFSCDQVFAWFTRLEMGKCGSKIRNGPVDRLGKDYDYMAGAGTSGFGLDYNRNGYGGYGSGNGGYGLESSCAEGVNQNTALLATAAAIAVGAGVIYRAVTLQQGKRRKREVDGDGGMIQDRLMDLIAVGDYVN